MSIRRSLTVLLSGNVAFFIIQFGASLVLARLLTPAEMGVYAAAMAVVVIANAVLNVGLTGYLIRERELPPDKLGTVYAITLVRVVLLGSAFYFGAGAVGWLADDARVTQAIRILTLFAVAAAVSGTLHGLLQRRAQFGRMTLVNLTNVAVSAAFTIGLAFAGWGWSAMAWGTGIGSCASLTLTLFLLPRSVWVRPSLAYWREVSRFGTTSLSTALIVNVAARAPDILLTRLAGAAATGLYNRGTGLVDIVTRTVMQSFRRVMANQFVRDRDTKVGLGPGYVHMSRIVTGIFWPGFAVLAVLGGPIIGLVYGEQWLAAAPVLAMVAVAAALNLSVTCRSELLIAVGRERELPRFELVRAVVGIGSFAIFAHWGLVWAAASRILDAGVACALYAPGIRRITRLSWKEMARPFARSAMVSATTVAPAIAVMTAERWPRTLPAVELFAALGACALAWLVGVFVTRHDLSAEIVRALRAVLPPRLRFRA